MDSCREGCTKRRVIWSAVGLFLVLAIAVMTLIDDMVEIWVSNSTNEVATFESLLDDEMPQNPENSRDFNPRVLLEPQEPIINPEVFAGISITPEVVRGNDLVLGISIGLEARAYPVNMLTGPDREIVNDRLGGTRIAATW